MAGNAVLLKDVIRVNPRFQRSVHLEKDYQTRGQDQDYHITPTAMDMLRRMAAGFQANATVRAWTLTGPYGVGKSAFGVFLTRVLCDSSEQGIDARHRLQSLAPALADSILERAPDLPHKPGVFPILVTARRGPAICIIADALMDAHKRLGCHFSGADAFIANRAEPDTKTVLDMALALIQLCSEAHFSGILLLIDEMGKLFEYAARYPQKGDLFILQMLAEMANRSGSLPFLIAGFLHQSFEEYAVYLDLVTRREWAKIQGRFEDIPFVEPASQLISLVSCAVGCQPGTFDPAIEKSIRKVVGFADRTRVIPPETRKEQFESDACSAYPLHPVSLASLPHFFRRFAQNERSLFSFLCSQEPGGFQHFIAHAHISHTDIPFIRLCDLFDYVIDNMGAGLYRQAHARRLIEAMELLDQHPDLPPVHVCLIKTIGFLTTLGEVSPLKPTREIIGYALWTGNPEKNTIQDALTELTGRSLITFRKYNNTYRIWEGSDIDINARVAEGERRTRCEVDLARMITNLAGDRRMVARRHSYDTGAFRFFSIAYANTPEQAAEMRKETFSSDGRIMVCLIETARAESDFIYLAENEQTSAQLFAIPQQIGPLRAVATELTALQWVQDNTPELRDDRAARRELSLRIADATQIFTRCLNMLLDPRQEPLGCSCAWYWQGKRQQVDSFRDITRLLSDVCDTIYYQSPKIRNELIVRRAISSAAAAARRNLIEHMLTSESLETLGIEGYPPERSIYESVLHETGIHRMSKKNDGTWHLGQPMSVTESGKSLIPVWQHIEQAVFTEKPELVALDRLYAELMGPPYGVAPGLHSILIVSFILANRDLITIYREGSFLAEPGIADFEVLIRCPELYAISGNRLAGQRLVVVQRLARGLDTPAQTVPVVRTMFQKVKSLSKFAWNTGLLDPKTIALRKTFEEAISPEKFLFEDLSAALGHAVIGEEQSVENPFDLDAFFMDLNQAIQEWQGIAQIVFEEVCHQLLCACGQTQAKPMMLKGWARLQQQANQILHQVTDNVLHTFVQRIVSADSSIDGMRNVIALVAKKPFESWKDTDVDGFVKAVEPFGNGFKQAFTVSAPERWKQMSANLTEIQQQKANQLFSTFSDYISHLRELSGDDVILTVLTRLSEELEKKGQP